MANLTNTGSEDVPEYQCDECGAEFHIKCLSPKSDINYCPGCGEEVDVW